MNKILTVIGKGIFTVCGCFLMLLMLFYLHFYEFKPIYKPVSN